MLEKEVDVRLQYVKLEMDDDCTVAVRREGDDIAVFIRDEYEDFEIALAFSPERFQKFAKELWKYGIG